MTALKKNDTIFIGITFALIFAGLLIFSSASLGFAARADRNYYFPLVKQLLVGIGGIVALIITSRIHYKKWEKFALPVFLTGFFLTLLVMVPSIGFVHGGAQRWLSLGPITFQPSELLKFSFVVYLSSWLAKRQSEVSSFKNGFLPFLIIIGFVSATLIIQPDIGTLGVIAFSGAILFFLAGGKSTQLGLLVILGLLLLFVLVSIKPYMMDRILVFQNSSHDTQGAGYQLSQAKIALGSGGMFGRGFGQGLSKFNYLPEPMGDSIFAVIGEEFGFLGTSFIIFLFFIFFYKILKIAAKTQDMFGRLLVSGIGILIIVQSFINMYAMVGLVPLTGLPLIFISQGGSALAISLAEIGVVLNVAKNNK